ncbi:MAG TPA: hypothetical protein VHE58_04235 [Burkholderiales bacterium]|nr:hypothetical protein [Burkholderiales bacterium]
MNNQESRYMPPRRYLYIFYALICVLSFLAFLEYPGQGQIYVLFTIISTALLYFGFRKNAIFFDTFIGIFFWLGFWLKLTFRVAFLDGQFHEPVGNFDGSGAAFDRALLVTSCGFLGLLSVSFLRAKYVFTYPEKITEVAQKGLIQVYQHHRKVVLLGFVILFVTVAVINIYFGIYQRGAIPRTILPYGLSGIYSWLLLFGLASISALILHFEFTLNKKTSYPVVILSLVEGFLTNVSLLSRGMILNTGALGYGVFRSLKFYSIESSFRFLVVSFLIFILLFGTSVILVEHLRSIDPRVLESINISDLRSFDAFKKLLLKLHINNIKVLAKGRETPAVLILDRWVGIEGVMAVSSYPKQGWDLWSEAWKETPSNKMSFYDTNLITSPYRYTDRTKYHYISLPGILAFCFYPGSFPFLFCCMFILGAIAAAIEISVFKLGGGNIILCALLAQVVASRFAHFGYVPSRSYLLFGSLYLNLFIIYFSNEFLLYWNKRKE